MYGNLSWWLTPIWMLSVGVVTGAAILVVLYCLLWLVSRRAAASVGRTVREGILQYTSYLLLVYAVLAVLIPAAGISKVQPLFDSLKRLPYVRPVSGTVDLPPHTTDKEVNVEFVADELQSYSFNSQQDIFITAEKGKSLTAPLFEVAGNEPYEWTPGGIKARGFDGTVDKFYITNDSDAPTTVTYDFKADVALPEVNDIPIAAGAVVGLYLVYLLIQWLQPGVSAIALATTKECIAQPVYLLLVALGAGLLLLFIYLPYNTFGEDVKILKHSGLMTIMLLAIGVGVWTASTSVADEIEGRTALTLLSKPISRRQFVLGKFLGIVWPVLLLFILLGSLLLITVSYKVVYDARESTNPDPNWQACYAEMIGTVPGLVLAFMETVVLTAISVAVSTRLSMLPNLIICGAFYVLGHLMPPIVQSSAGENEYVAFFGKVSAIVIPVLDHFDIQAAVAGGVPVPWTYLGWALLYCALYSGAMMLLALILFEDRDLA